ncbi:MAG: PilW family protein [Candidatus Electronema sp. V4]|uniref:PilW family protein n=1 Tax=Candidatus Electronema sp. V4 TaxID=3454756 RepID=UPI00405590E2
MKRIQESGMTLIEIMVSVAISSLIFSGIYGVYTIQQRSYTVQEQVTEMQQRIRSTVDFIGRDIRMAGHNPDHESACAGSEKIETAEKQKMVFNACNLDKKDDTYKDYRITIEFKKDDRELHLTRDEDMDGASSMPIAFGVDDFLIRYLGKDLEVASSLKDIRYVQIAMLVRSTYPDKKYTDSIQYTLGSGHTWGPANDNYHRRLLITTIQVRNMAVQ